MNRATPTSRILQSTWRDARLVIAVWLASCFWCVGWAAAFAYRPDAGSHLIAGIPSWVVWGVLAPWVACTLITVWYALCGMEDVDLGEDQPLPETDPHG